MGLQFPSCTTFELIEVFIPDQPHQELTAKEIMGLKMAVRQQQGNWGERGSAAQAGQENIITRLCEIWISQNNNQSAVHTERAGRLPGLAHWIGGLLKKLQWHNKLVSTRNYISILLINNSKCVLREMCYMFKWPWLLTNHPSIHSDLIPETALQQGYNLFLTHN